MERSRLSRSRFPPRQPSHSSGMACAPEWGIGSQAGEIHQTDVNTGVYTPRVRSLKVSFAPFLRPKLHRNLHTPRWARHPTMTSGSHPSGCHTTLHRLLRAKRRSLRRAARFWFLRLEFNRDRITFGYGGYRHNLGTVEPSSPPSPSTCTNRSTPRTRRVRDALSPLHFPVDAVLTRVPLTEMTRSKGISGSFVSFTTTDVRPDTPYSTRNASAGFAPAALRAGT